MSPKFFITAGLIIGSTIGGYIPALWGDSFFSLTSIVGNLIGGIAGVFAGIWVYNNYFE